MARLTLNTAIEFLEDMSHRYMNEKIENYLPMPTQASNNMLNNLYKYFDKIRYNTEDEHRYWLIKDSIMQQMKDKPHRLFNKVTYYGKTRRPLPEYKGNVKETKNKKCSIMEFELHDDYVAFLGCIGDTMEVYGDSILIYTGHNFSYAYLGSYIYKLICKQATKQSKSDYNKVRSLVFKLAHKIRKGSFELDKVYPSFGECLKEAWNVLKELENLIFEIVWTPDSILAKSKAWYVMYENIMDNKIETLGDCLFDLYKKRSVDMPVSTNFMNIFAHSYGLELYYHNNTQLCSKRFIPMC